MMESKVFADNFSRSFSESGDFFQFLSARQARSKWMTAPSKELRFEPVERGSTLGNLYMQIYDHPAGICGDVLYRGLHAQ